MDIRFLIEMIITLVGLSFFIPAYDLSKDSKVHCGFPGIPKFGMVRPDEDLYDEGDVVSYTCRVGYILLGKSIRRCKEDGTWTEDIPICDDSMTTLGTALSSPTVPGNPAELAIDRNKDSCTSLKPSTQQELRWWEIDLAQDHKVLSVAITLADTDKYVDFVVYVVKYTGSSAAYKICASFSGKFGTQTILLSCAEGKGIVGKRVHLADSLPTDGLLDICEVEVQVEKDTGYACGKPDRNPHSIHDEPEYNEVRYDCVTGYKLDGPAVRTCMGNGRWSGKPPKCEAIICDELEPIENGEVTLSVINGDIPLQGTVANYICNKGYNLDGSYSRICLDDGKWSDKKPRCEAIRCPAILDAKKKHGGFFRLINGTGVGSVAILKCRKGKSEGDKPYIVCTEEGDWTETNARCLIPARVSSSVEESPRIVNKEVLIFGMVVAGIMITVVIVSMYVVMQRRRNGNKPEVPSRLIEAPEAPPRPPPRSKGASILDFMSRKGAQFENQDSSWKTRSLPLDQNEKKEAWPATSPSNRATSYDHHLQDEPTKSSKASSPLSDVSTNINQERSATNTPDIEQGKTESPAPAKKVPGREYAAVDYEKKRQSRLLKGQSSEDGDSDRTKTPTSIDETEDSVPPTVPPKGTKKDDSSKPTDDDNLKPARGTRTRTKPKPEEKGKGTRTEPPEPEDKEEKTKTEPEAEDKRRTRRTEPEKEPESEDKGKRTRRTRAQVETPEEEPTSARRTRRTRGIPEDEG